MNAIDIPRAEWRTFLAGFVGVHRDWLVNVKLAGPHGGASADERAVALAGIRLEDDAHGRPRVTFEVRDRSGRLHAEPPLDDVTRLRVLQREDGVEAALSVESADGTRLLMHFLSPQPPDAVDGLEDASPAR